MSESRTFAKERGSQQEYGEEKVDSTVKEGRFQGSEGGQARKAFLEEAEESLSGSVDARALHEDQRSLGFATSLDKPEMGKEVGRRSARS